MYPDRDILKTLNESTDFYFKNIFIYNGSLPYLNNDLLFSDKLQSHFPDFDKIESSPFNLYQNRLKKVSVGLKAEELNSLNFRCDEFKKNHNGKHILFSGCSNTWGVGLLKEETWAYKTYNLISKENLCSGYYNLALQGTSMQSQIFNLFKYFKQYGNPDIIFINFPDLLRFHGYYDKAKMFFDAFYKPESKEIFKLMSFQYYFMLDQYCKTNNIQLYSFSWITAPQKTPMGHPVLKIPLDSFDSYYDISIKDLRSYVKQQKNNFVNDIPFFWARDEEHPGTIYQDYWTNFIYKEYKKKNDNLRN